MSEMWYCPTCGYEVDRGGRCHNCREPLVATEMTELAEGEADEEVGYRLDGWDDEPRGALIEGLVDAGIRHRFEGDELVVGADDEERVDALVAEAPGGAEGDGGPGEVNGELDPETQAAAQALLDAADRLRVDPTDMDADSDLAEASAAIFAVGQPPEVDPETWSAIGRVTRRLLGALGADEALEQQIATQSSILCRLVGPIVGADGAARGGTGRGGATRAGAEAGAAAAGGPPASGTAARRRWSRGHPRRPGGSRAGGRRGRGRGGHRRGGHGRRGRTRPRRGPGRGSRRAGLRAR